MKTLAVALGAGIAASAGRILSGTTTNQVVEPQDRRERRRQRRKPTKGVYRPRRGSRSRYTPHQGEREQARRIRQLMDGQLRCWEPPVEPTPAAPEPAPIKASVLIENGLEAERRAKRSEAARKAAATRAARKLEAANG
jgi:hypothetical protein